MATPAQKIDDLLSRRISFGIESTFSGIPGPELLHRVIASNYRVEGWFLGTASPDINIQRIRERVLLNRGHSVDESLIPNRYKYSLSNLRKYVNQFDQLVFFDNSDHEETGIPQPIRQGILERSKVISSADLLSRGCRTFLERVQRAQEQAKIRERRSRS